MGKAGRTLPPALDDKNPAIKSVIPKIQALHGLKIVFPLKKPIALNVTRNTGSSKAIP